MGYAGSSDSCFRTRPFFFYEKLIKEVVGEDDDFGNDNMTPLSFGVVTKMGIDWLNELDNESDEDDSVFGSKSLDFDLNGENGEGEEWKRYANDRPLNASGDDRRLGRRFGTMQKKLNCRGKIVFWTT